MIALTLFSYLYYNPPIHSVCLDGATDYIWEKNMIYNRATEGIGYGKTNNEGYMNLYDYQSGMNIDVLVMGSSHLEAQFIPLEKNAVSLLNSKSQRTKAYNISISGHSFKVCVNNLEAALSKYKPEYVVIEKGNSFAAFLYNGYNNAKARRAEMAAVLRERPAEMLREAERT